MAIPTSINQRLVGDEWRRSSDAGLQTAFHELGVSASDPLHEFYSKFQGPFGSETSGYELLDLVDQNESIMTNTRVVRSQFGFPFRYVVLTSMVGGAVLVYDIQTGSVFDVDFEGGDDLLLKGELFPRWSSLWQFLEMYFS